jgi:nucleotide-binding universal stress UspA family protein
MPSKVFVAIDQRDIRHSVIAFASRLAAETSTVVRVFHGIEFVGRGCAAPLESRDEAELVVEEAVFHLRMAGVGAAGLVRPCFHRDVSRMIVDEANRWGADTIVVGGRQGRGPGRVLGHGIRERVLRRSALTVKVAPPEHVSAARIRRTG